MAYDFNKNVCDNCGVTKEEAKKYLVISDSDYLEHEYSTSFYLNRNGGAICTKCFKEMGIHKVMEVPS